MSNSLILTAAMLNKAKGSEINHYIDEINKNAGKKLLTKQGNNEERRKRVAGHFMIDLAATMPLETITGPLTVDEKVGEDQWRWIRTLGQEWADTEKDGKSFKLWPDNSSELYHIY